MITTRKKPTMITVGPVERNIPLPRFTKMPRQNPLAEAVKDMKVGESRVIEIPYSISNVNNIRTKINTIQKNSDKLMPGLNLEERRFTTNKDPYSDKIRVWRIE